MAKDLTKLALDNLKPREARYEVPDGHTRGLHAVVQPSGKISWALRYRVSGQSRKLTLGAYPQVDLRVARELARRALAKIAAGDDPAAEKQAINTTARTPADHDLVEKVAAEFVTRYAKPTQKAWRETERLLNKEVVASWRGRRLSQITRPEVHALLDAICDRGSPITANRAFAALRRMCSWAVERGVIEASPCEKIKAPSAERRRDRVLSDDELRAVWLATDAIGWPFGPAVKMLILTGQRRDEVGSMRWGEINVDKAEWIIPAERAKNARAHSVPLSPQALAVLQSLPQIEGGDDHVFSTTGSTAISGFSKAKTRLDVATTGAPHWTLHDLRRTAATGMAALGVNIPVIEKVLNHVSGSFAGIVGVYQRHGFGDEKRAALELWGRHVEALAADETGNVVSIRAPLATTAT
jgi:integrase